MKINRQNIWKPILVLVAYFITARLEMQFATIPPGNLTAVWFPSGVAFAAMLFLGWPALPAVWLGAFVAITLNGTHAWIAAGMAIGSALGPFVGASLLKRSSAGQHPFTRKWLFGFFLAAILSCVISATIGILCLAYYRLVDWGTFFGQGFFWWLADFCGIVIITPLMLSFSSQKHLEPPTRTIRLPELGVYYLLTILFCGLVFIGVIPREIAEPLPYLSLILIGWGALRFRLREVAMVVFIISCAAVQGVVTELGPFSEWGISFNLLNSTIFMVLLELVALLLVSIVGERRFAQKELRQANRLLEERVLDRTAALQTSENRYRSVVEEQTELVVNLKPDGALIFVNDAFCRYFGLQSEAVIGQILPHMPVGMRTEFLRQLEFNSRQSQVFHSEHPYFTPGGEARWLSWNIKSILGSDGLISEYLAVGQDRTESRKIELELHESRERYQALFEDSPIALKEEDFSEVKIILDGLRQQGVTDLGEYIINNPQFVSECINKVHIQDINKATMRVYGAEDKETLLKNLDIISGPDAEIGFRKQLINLFNGVTNYDIETVNYSLSGEPIDLLLRWAAAPGYESSVSKVIISILDITERKRVEEELRNSQRLLQMVLDNIPMAVFWKDLNSVYRGGNLVQARQSNLEDPSQIIGKTDYDFPWPDQAESYIAEDRRVIESGIPEYHNINRMTRNNGQEMWIDSSKIPMLDENGSITGVLGTWYDITDQVLAEEARMVSERKFHMLFEQSYDGIVISGMDGVINEWNLRMEEITGLKAGEALGQTIWKVNASLAADVEHRPFVEEMIRKEFEAMRETGQMPSLNRPIDLTILRADGEVRRVQMVIFQIGSGKEGMIVSLTRDMTEQDQIQRIALESQKLANLGTLAAGIAHEINSPLQIINGLSERMLERVKSEKIDHERLIRDLNNINRNGWRVAHIVRSLLTYARASAGDYVESSLNEIIHDTLLLIEHQLMSWSSISIQTNLQPDLPPFLCDSNKITQLIINLLDNARDSMPQGGVITIRSYSRAEDGLLVLQVNDQGRGISPEIRDRIFDPFFTTKEVGYGTGLGLSIVLGVVKSHGGQIEVESLPGEGTSFTITLPLTPPPIQHPDNNPPKRFKGF